MHTAPFSPATVGRTARTALVGLLLGAAGACNTANVVRPTGPTVESGPVPYEQITSNGWLRSKANVTAARETTVSGNLRKVAVDVFSDQLTTQRFSYRFEWLDAAGMPVPSATAAMTSATIEPRMTITLTSVAPTPAATTWRLTLLDQRH